MSKCILRFDINYLFKDFVFFQNYDFIDLDLNQLYYAACLLHFFRDWVKKNHTWCDHSFYSNCPYNSLRYFLTAIFKLNFFT